MLLGFFKRFESIILYGIFLGTKMFRIHKITDYPCLLYFLFTQTRVNIIVLNRNQSWLCHLPGNFLISAFVVVKQSCHLISKQEGKSDISLGKNNEQVPDT